MENCVFCDKDKNIVYENRTAFVIYDNYPVAKGHALIIPKRHIEDFFAATEEEMMDFHDALQVMKTEIDKNHAPDGYNIGVNVGEAAGQTVFHLHIHLIPRYLGDVKAPRGGVRGVIPNKQSY